jgi:acyl carrier protein
MSSSTDVKTEIFAHISRLLKDETAEVTDEMPLIGGDSALDSINLVELCLALEDKAAEMGFEFDWTSDMAMSRSRSMFRTAGALVSEFQDQMGRKK